MKLERMMVTNKEGKNSSWSISNKSSYINSRSYSRKKRNIRGNSRRYSKEEKERMREIDNTKEN